MDTTTPSRAATLKLDKAVEYELKHGRKKLDPNMDTKKLRRTISNRLSAQRSRVKRAHYINGIQKMVKDLEKLISGMTPQIDSYKQRMALMNIENESLKKLIELRTKESKLSQMEIERKEAEICRLRELHNTMKTKSGESSNHSFGYDQNTNNLEQLGFEQHEDKDEETEEAEIDMYINFEQVDADQAGASEENRDVDDWMFSLM